MNISTMELKLSMKHKGVARIGFSLLEVMIAIAILASALSVAIGTIFTLHQGRAALEEELKAQAIAQIMVERLQGASWDSLGKHMDAIPGHNAWSWHRRATRQLVFTPTMDPTVTPPMREKASRPEDDLIALGILSSPSGVKNLNVYLEYYQMRLVERVNELMAAADRAEDTEEVKAKRRNPGLIWREAVGDPIQGKAPTADLSTDDKIYLPEDPNVLNLSTVKSAVLMRVLISWESAVGGIRWHEVVVSRRK
jgi:prepilin-type N-terminal cleavage/methylation domain-containing protein